MYQFYSRRQVHEMWGSCTLILQWINSVYMLMYIYWQTQSTFLSVTMNISAAGVFISTRDFMKCELFETDKNVCVLKFIPMRIPPPPK